MKKEICSTLAEIEKLHNVKILYACESSSRAFLRRILITTPAISTFDLSSRI